MMKVTLLIAFALVGAASAQELLAVGPQGEAAPEPYSYGYETETHAAAEQRDPSGKVSGYYTLAGPDGRQRRVEYIADEAGFRAKVATNEVGTKSENSADVLVEAQPPTREQLVQGEVSNQRAVNTAAVLPAQQARYTSFASQPQYAAYGSSYNGAYGYGNGLYNNGAYGYANNNGNYLVRSGYLNGNGAYSNYNNHLPSQYYRSIGAANNGAYVAGANAGRYATAAPGVALANGQYRSYTTTLNNGAYGYGNGLAYNNGAYGYGNGLAYNNGVYGYGNGNGLAYGNGLSYTTGPVRSAQYSSYSTLAPNNNLLGSSNYVVLKKRAAASAAAKKA